MLLHKSGQPHYPAPEAVYLRRILAWSAVVVAALVGIELIIDDYTVIGAFVTVLAAVGAFTLRSPGFSRFLHAPRPPARDDEEQL